ncbi:MAG: 30S ribosomal protein S6 [Bacteroidetes bacterium]|nr:30S ribosomal protein S6 [Bacteroidota bacterium]
MNNYETVFISTPVLSSDEYSKTVKKYTDFLEKNGGKLVSKEDWEFGPSLPDTKKTSGFYTLIEFQIDGSMIKKMEVEFKRDENIMRFLTVSLDKFAVKYAEGRRARLSGKKTEKTEA